MKQVKQKGGKKVHTNFEELYINLFIHNYLQNKTNQKSINQCHIRQLL
jgi:hypothetical protein